MLVGDLNAEDSETCLSNFFFAFNARIVVNNYITNNPVSFQNTVTIRTGLFSTKREFTVLKAVFTKLFPKINYILVLLKL